MQKTTTSLLLAFITYYSHTCSSCKCVGRKLFLSCPWLPVTSPCAGCIACFPLAWPHLPPEPAGLAQTCDSAVEAFCPKTGRVNSSSSSAGAVRPHQKRSKMKQHRADGPPWSTAGRRGACECKAELSLGISSDGGWQPRQLPLLPTSLLLSVPSPCRTPQLCSRPSHLPKKTYF